MRFSAFSVLKILSSTWTGNTRHPVERRNKRERRQGGGDKEGADMELWGEQARHFSCTHLGQETLFGKNICGELMYFIIAIKDPFFPRIISSPHLVEWIRSAIYGALFTCLHLFKGIICKTIAWFLDQDYSYTFWRENEVQEEFSSQDR